MQAGRLILKRPAFLCSKSFKHLRTSRRFFKILLHKGHTEPYAYGVSNIITNQMSSQITYLFNFTDIASMVLFGTRTLTEAKAQNCTISRFNVVNLLTNVAEITTDLSLEDIKACAWHVHCPLTMRSLAPQAEFSNQN